jgi:hypothetical protein
LDCQSSNSSLNHYISEIGSFPSSGEEKSLALGEATVKPCAVKWTDQEQSEIILMATA